MVVFVLLLAFKADEAPFAGDFDGVYLTLVVDAFKGELFLLVCLVVDADGIIAAGLRSVLFERRTLL